MCIRIFLKRVKQWIQINILLAVYLIYEKINTSHEKNKKYKWALKGQLSYFFDFVFRRISTPGHILRLTMVLEICNFAL